MLHGSTQVQIVQALSRLSAAFLAACTGESASQLIYWESATALGGSFHALRFTTSIPLP